MRYRDLDWEAIWQAERRHKTRPRRNPADWDRRAADFAARNYDSPYTTRFLDQFSWQPQWTVLDAGCGPGTLTLPLAGLVREVTAIDYSPAMLEHLERERNRRGITNVRALRAAWEDDWQALGIPAHDVVVASRSLAVDDLAAALGKVDRWAKRLAIVVDRVGAGPFDPELFRALQRPFDPGPDYIITVNLLYRMGIQARVDFIVLDHERVYPDRQRALASLLWMIPTDQPLNVAEEERLARYVDERLEPRPGGGFNLRRDTPSRWAVLSWDASDHGAPRDRLPKE